MRSSRAAPVATTPSSGFTLLEAIVALVVVAIVLTGGLRLFTLQAATADRVGEDAMMAQLASALLAQDAVLEINVVGTDRGELGDVLWTIERLPFEPALRDARSRPPRSGSGPRLLLVRATVMHQAGSVTLSTLRLVPRG